MKWDSDLKGEGFVEKRRLEGMKEEIHRPPKKKRESVAGRWYNYRAV